MDIDPNLAKLGIDLAEAAARNTASHIADKIRTVKAKKNDKETVAEFEQIVNDLISDKSEIQRIAQAYEQELASQKITKEDIKYITDNLFPVIDGFITDERQKAGIGQIKSLLSLETLTIMQLIGFNYKRAIGEPLTLLLQRFIEAKAPVNSADNAKYMALYAELSLNKEAYDRFIALIGKRDNND